MSWQRYTQQVKGQAVGRAAVAVPAPPPLRRRRTLFLVSAVRGVVEAAAAQKAHLRPQARRLRPRGGCESMELRQQRLGHLRNRGGRGPGAGEEQGDLGLLSSRRTGLRWPASCPCTAQSWRLPAVCACRPR